MKISIDGFVYSRMFFMYNNAQIFLEDSENHLLSTQSQWQRALWRAVILQAFMDSVSNCQRTESKIAKHSARDWLTGMGKDFKLVCSMAGYNATYVKRKADVFIHNDESVTKVLNELAKTA